MNEPASTSKHETIGTTDPSSATALEYVRQAVKLSLEGDQDGQGKRKAVEAKFITPHDPVIATTDGTRLPAVPVTEAAKLNKLKGELEGQCVEGWERAGETTEKVGSKIPEQYLTPSSYAHHTQRYCEGSLGRSIPPDSTSPLFPPLPLYGPPTSFRNLQCWTLRMTSFFISNTFLGVLVICAACTTIPVALYHGWLRLIHCDPDLKRPFIKEEQRMQKLRLGQNDVWKKRELRRMSKSGQDDNEADATDGCFIATEGGPDPVICDVGYYARRVGLNVEEFKVQTEDGFLIALWHVYNPLEYEPLSTSEREARGPELSTNGRRKKREDTTRKPKFPVLMIHGLLQSSGAYCVNDDTSLAFYLCKSGYDVWLGNSRCGFTPEHTSLSYSDPRMWAWNIRQMGVMDLPALTSRVLFETGLEKVGLIGHSQGTTQTFVALAKDQRPEFGEKLTVFCALSPAAYAGSLLNKWYVRIIRMLSPKMFRIAFGVHAFIPIMMTMHSLLPGRLFGRLAYPTFNYMFEWTDTRWDRGLRDRMFQFAPVFVSAESMRWWLGKDSFAKQGCILITNEQLRKEDEEDAVEENRRQSRSNSSSLTLGETAAQSSSDTLDTLKCSSAWYDAKVPPFALWIAGSDALVDGRKLLKRFGSGREPHVRVVHSKVIPEYEHLDVIWAMDAIEQVGREVRDVLWKTCNVRDKVRVPVGCEHVHAWRDPKINGKEQDLVEGSAYQ